LDHALFRRFDDVIRYELPNAAEAQQLMTNRLGAFKSSRMALGNLVKNALPLSHAEIAHACEDAIKESILNDQKTVTASVLKEMLQDRRLAYGPMIENN